MKKFLGIVAIAFLAVTLLVGSALGFDKLGGRISEFQGKDYVYLQDTVVYVETEGEAEGFVYMNDKWTIMKGRYTQRGVGFVIPNNFIVTAAHVVVPRVVEIKTAPWQGWITPVVNVRSRSIWVGEPDSAFRAQPYYVDEEHDIAVLRYFGGILKPFQYEFARTWGMWQGRYYQIIASGDVVAMVVRVRDNDKDLQHNFEVRYGKIVDVKPVLPDKSTESLPWFNMNDFTTTIPVYPGDSGSPVFAFSHGKPVIIGIARALSKTLNGTYSYATRVDFIKRFRDLGKEVTRRF